MNRMKIVMPVLVSDTQDAFMHDFSIFNNILVAYEVAHSKQGKRFDHVGFLGG